MFGRITFLPPPASPSLGGVMAVQTVLELNKSSLSSWSIHMMQLFGFDLQKRIEGIECEKNTWLRRKHTRST